MIEFGVTLLLISISALVFVLIEPIRDTTRALTELLDGIDTHRRAQAGSVLKHAGLLETVSDEDDDE